MNSWASKSQLGLDESAGKSPTGPASPEEHTGRRCHQALQGALFDLLDEEVPLILRCLAVLGTNNTGWPVEIEHVHQLLLLAFQLLNLGLQLSIDGLQLF
ncbi:hypothetical protein JZ751_005110 [Albula glossodonta]|uniref:Uncharacterized protein n=1 Tax=Albula glossodonta TaxID=121402 RepID=A0A8T2PD27_9TELE|nr:hypothetical protein JZ751_005110 [Albula glossodonta]